MKALAVKGETTMSSFENALRTVIREELSRGAGSKKERIRALAQEILDEVRPDKTVQEVLININSAEPIEQVIEQAKEIVENAKKQPKRVFTVMYRSQLTEGKYWPSKVMSQNQFDSLAEAIAALDVYNSKWEEFYFIWERDVDTQLQAAE